MSQELRIMNSVKTKTFFLILFLSVFGLAGNSLAETCEATYGHHCYYVSTKGNDVNDGSFANPFRTVQKGFDTIAPGDYLYMMNGTYAEHVEIKPYNKAQGDPEHWYTVKSYPGEWAIINPAYSSACPVVQYGINVPCGTHGGHGDPYAPKYWKFEHFEVTGGGIDDTQGGSGMRFNTGENMLFDHMYIHDNRGSSSDNNGGIVFSNSDNAPREITIQNCYIKDNACSDLHNCANIALFSDYREDPTTVNIARALTKNVIKNNLLDGSNVGIKYKNSQWLSLSHAGTDMAYKDYGDQIYNNIIKNAANPFLAFQDFIQIHDNIFEGNHATVGETSGNDREPFYAVVYNNLFLGSRFSLDHGVNHADNSSYDVPTDYPDLHPHFYFYNNIFENVGAEYDGHNDFNLMFTWSGNYQNYLNMNTINTENNLFYPKTSSEEIIDIGDDANDFSANQYEAAGYAAAIYTSTSAGLHSSGENYKLNRDFVLEGAKTIANGGVNIPHPYLSDIQIPAYVGPCAENSCSWVDSVNALSNISNLIEGISGMTEPASPVGLSVS